MTCRASRGSAAARRRSSWASTPALRSARATTEVTASCAIGPNGSVGLAVRNSFLASFGSGVGGRRPGGRTGGGGGSGGGGPGGGGRGGGRAAGGGPG